MWRNLVAMLSFLAFCLSSSQILMAQQAGADQAGGSLSIQGPQMLSGEEMRASRQPGQLVGGEAQGVGALRSETEAAGAGNRQGVGRGGTQRGMNQLMNQFNRSFMGSRYTRDMLRVPISLGFKPTILAERPDPGKRVQDRLARTPRLRGNGPMTVEMDGPVAILRGQVKSQDERDLIARVALLEAGISGVRNELQVATAKAAP